MPIPDLSIDDLRRIAEAVRRVEGTPRDLTPARKQPPVAWPAKIRRIETTAFLSRSGNIGSYTVRELDPTDESEIRAGITPVYCDDGGTDLPTGTRGMLGRSAEGDLWMMLSQTTGTIRSAVPVPLGTWCLDLRELDGNYAVTEKQAWHKISGDTFFATHKCVVDEELQAGVWTTCPRACYDDAGGVYGAGDDSEVPQDTLITDLMVQASTWSSNGPYSGISFRVVDEAMPTWGDPPTTGSLGISAAPDYTRTHGTAFGVFVPAAAFYEIQIKSATTQSVKIAFWAQVIGTQTGRRALWEPNAQAVEVNKIVAYHDNLLTAGTVTAKLVYRAAPTAGETLTMTAGTGSPASTGIYAPNATYLSYPRFDKAGGGYSLFATATDFWIAATPDAAPADGWKLTGLLTAIGTYTGQGAEAGTTVVVTWTNDV